MAAPTTSTQRNRNQDPLCTSYKHNSNEPHFPPPGNSPEANQNNTRPRAKHSRAITTPQKKKTDGIGPSTSATLLHLITASSYRTGAIQSGDTWVWTRWSTSYGYSSRGNEPWRSRRRGQRPTVRRLQRRRPHFVNPLTPPNIRQTLHSLSLDALT